jgi:hypothetical protein
MVGVHLGLGAIAIERRVCRLDDEPRGGRVVVQVVARLQHQQAIATSSPIVNGDSLLLRSGRLPTD